jgi:sugar lactone lactonase YvrE
MRRPLIIALIALVVAGTACAGIPLHAPAQSAPQSIARASNTQPLLYVSNFATSTVTVYKADQQDPSPIETLTDGIVAPQALWIDTAGTLYVSNDFGQNNPYADTVTEFAPGTQSPTKVLTGLDFPSAIAVDSRGTVYVQDYSNLEVYENGSTTPTRAITGQGDGASALAIDDHDNVYALVQTFRGQNEECYSYVVKIARGASGGKLTGISVLGCGDGLALDSHENLYLAEYGDHNQSKIKVYPPGGKTPIRIITSSLNAPQRLAFDRDGELFVPNDNTSSVSVFAAGGSKPINRITKDLANPFDVAISPAAPY